MKQAKREPAVVAALARVAVLLGARFGLDLDVDDLVMVMVAAEPVITGLLRSFVSPTAAPASGGSDA